MNDDFLTGVRQWALGFILVLLAIVVLRLTFWFLPEISWDADRRWQDRQWTQIELEKARHGK